MASFLKDLWRSFVDASEATYSRDGSAPGGSPPSSPSSPVPDFATALTEPPYAGFWRRLGALVVDALVFLPVSAMMVWASSQSRSAALFLLVPSLALSCGYSIYFHARWGQTLGKMAAGVRVISARGGAIDLRQAVLRSSVDIGLGSLAVLAQAHALLQIPAETYASMPWLEQQRRLAELIGRWQWLSWLQTAWILSEVVTMLFNRRRRALHDFIGGTVVIRVRPSTAGVAITPLPGDV